MKNQVQLFNIDTLTATVLPTVYDTREEAMLAGQNYVRDRQNEDGSCIFYRVVKGNGETRSECLMDSILAEIHERLRN